MNNEPVAWRTHYPSGWEYKDGNPPFELKGNSQLLYTHPAKTPKDREADRKRFSDEAFNRWLDESITDSGHTVYDLVENVCEAWHGWENSQYYKPAKTLTDEEIMEYVDAFSQQEGSVYVFQEDNILEMIHSILRKAQEK